MPSVLSKLVPFAVAGTVFLTHAVLLRRSHAKHHEHQESGKQLALPIEEEETNKAVQVWVMHRAAIVVQSWVRVAFARRALESLRCQRHLRHSLAAAAIQAGWRQRQDSSSAAVVPNSICSSSSSEEGATMQSPDAAVSTRGPAAKDTSSHEADIIAPSESTDHSHRKLAPAADLSASSLLSPASSLGSLEQSRLKKSTVAAGQDGDALESNCEPLRSPISPRRLSLSSPPPEARAADAASPSQAVAADASIAADSSAAKEEVAVPPSTTSTTSTTTTSSTTTTTSSSSSSSSSSSDWARPARTRFGPIPKLGIKGPPRRLARGHEAVDGQGAVEGDGAEGGVAGAGTEEEEEVVVVAATTPPVEGGKKKVRIQEPPGGWLREPVRASASSMVSLPLAPPRPPRPQPPQSMSAAPPPSAVYFRPPPSALSVAHQLLSAVLDRGTDVGAALSAAIKAGARAMLQLREHAPDSPAQLGSSEPLLLMVFACSVAALGAVVIAVAGLFSVGAVPPTPMATPATPMAAPTTSPEASNASYADPFSLAAAAVCSAGLSAVGMSANASSASALFPSPSPPASSTASSSAAAVLLTTHAKGVRRAFAPLPHSRLRGFEAKLRAEGASKEEAQPAAKGSLAPGSFVSLSVLTGRIGRSFQRFAAAAATSAATSAVVPGMDGPVMGAFSSADTHGFAAADARIELAPPLRFERSRRGQLERLRLQLLPYALSLKAAVPQLLLPILAAAAVTAVAQSGVAGSAVMLAGLASASAGTWPRAFVWTRPIATVP
jgi:hypothetical protein